MAAQTDTADTRETTAYHEPRSPGSEVPGLDGVERGRLLVQILAKERRRLESLGGYLVLDGVQRRPGRQLLPARQGLIGLLKREAEELIAERGAHFLSAQHQFEGRASQHCARYLNSWIQFLETTTAPSSPPPTKPPPRPTR